MQRTTAAAAAAAGFYVFDFFFWCVCVCVSCRIILFTSWWRAVCVCHVDRETLPIGWNTCPCQIIIKEEAAFVGFQLVFISLALWQAQPMPHTSSPEYKLLYTGRNQGVSSLTSCIWLWWCVQPFWLYRSNLSFLSPSSLALWKNTIPHGELCSRRCPPRHDLSAGSYK
jgi:hypothetical protein